MPSPTSPPIRLIALDLDGTLLNSDKELTPRTRQALRRAIAAGIEVVPATGRPFRGIPSQVLAVPGIRYALSSNGAHVFDLASGRAVYSDCFDTPAALSVLALGKRFDGLLAIYIDGQGYTDSGDPSRMEGLLSPPVIEYLRTTRTPVNSLETLLRESAEPMEKLSILFTDAAEQRRAFAAFSARGDVTIANSLQTNIEVTTATGNKGAALLALAGILRIPREQVMAVGDSGNDLDMLRAAGYAVAMENGVPEAKAAAHRIAPCCDEDGAAEAIEAVLPPGA